MTDKSGMRPVHPGAVLGEELGELEMSATAFAAALGVPTNRITAILNGQRGVTADTALRLARYLGTSPQSWLTLQLDYELRTAELNSGEEIKRAVEPMAPGGDTDASRRHCPADDHGDGRHRSRRVPAIHPRVSIPKIESASLCNTHGIRKLSIFGSALRDDFTSDSDIDILVEFAPGRAPGLLGLAGIEIELSTLCGGRKVDVRTPEDLSRYFRAEILNFAEVQYAQT